MALLQAICTILVATFLQPVHLIQPNIVFILSDDQGYYDAGYKGSEILTPNLDALVEQGVRLENYYVQPICTPSRSQLLTGRHQIYTGMQNGVLAFTTLFGIPLENTLLPERLKSLGYATHMTGKWHVGYYMKDYTATFRGFESFYGLYNYAIDHYSKIWNGGYDFSFNTNETLSVHWNNMEYSTITLARRAVQVIETQPSEQPLFLYVAFNAPHWPLQVPDQYLEPYSWMNDTARKTYAGMVTCLDEAVGNITAALQASGLYDNTLIIFSSDNGGDVQYGASNWPLRGEKQGYYEGGVKGLGFVSSPLLANQGAETHGLMHISDWYPTLVHLAGGSTEDLPLDGYNVWDVIVNNTASPRKELLHNINPLEEKAGDNLYPDIFDVRIQASIRVGDWKLMTGNQKGYDTLYPRPPMPKSILKNTKKYRVVRQGEPENIKLFNLADDPTESNNLVSSYPEIVLQLLERLAFYNSTAVEAVNYAGLSDPDHSLENTDGAWVPWVE